MDQYMPVYCSYGHFGETDGQGSKIEFRYSD